MAAGQVKLIWHACCLGKSGLVYSLGLRVSEGGRALRRLFVPPPETSTSFLPGRPSQELLPKNFKPVANKSRQIAGSGFRGLGGGMVAG